MNRLQFESSPYLLQHASNPVDWYTWGSEALQRAKAEDKPILVSVGYSACHWCHVMERESFVDENIAELMNRHFVCIKIDREERPDLDNIFMQACQILTGSGGWPLHVFLTPDQMPFSAGTYFPPQRGFGKPAWQDVLQYMHTVFTKERDKVEEQADAIRNYMLSASGDLVPKKIQVESEQIFSEENILAAARSMQQEFDSLSGGFGSAPKFPGTMALRFLMRNAWFTGDEKMLEHVLFSLDAMARGGIYDHAGGGFARYATDAQWRIPHFEKMLYDNALLATIYAEAYRSTKMDRFRNTAEEVLACLDRDFLDPGGGYYAAYDADSEGIEGKYYTFTMAEWKEALGEDAALAANWFNIIEEGNWEHTNILYITADKSTFLEEHHFAEPEFDVWLEKVKTQLQTYRKKRTPPGLDNKIILSWNTMVCSAFAECFKAMQKEQYRNKAIVLFQYLSKTFPDPAKEGAMYHTVTGGIAANPAFLDDYAGYIQAALDLYDITSEEHYLTLAEGAVAFVHAHFNAQNGLYYFSPDFQKDLPLRTLEIYDNATPSSNSTMLMNYVRLRALKGDALYAARADAMLASTRDAALKYGTAYGNWLQSALMYVYPINEIVITGPEAYSWRDTAFQKYTPHAVYACDESGKKTAEIFRARFDNKATRLFVCRQFSCAQPVTALQDFIHAEN